MDRLSAKVCRKSSGEGGKPDKPKLPGGGCVGVHPVKDP